MTVYHNNGLSSSLVIIGKIYSTIFILSIFCCLRSFVIIKVNTQPSKETLLLLLIGTILLFE